MPCFFFFNFECFLLNFIACSIGSKIFEWPSIENYALRSNPFYQFNHQSNKIILEAMAFYYLENEHFSMDFCVWTFMFMTWLYNHRKQFKKFYFKMEKCTSVNYTLYNFRKYFQKLIIISFNSAINVCSSSFRQI